jgi:hypothetical protein
VSERGGELEPPRRPSVEDEPSRAIDDQVSVLTTAEVANCAANWEALAAALPGSRPIPVVASERRRRKQLRTHIELNARFVGVQVDEVGPHAVVIHAMKGLG